jgi:hypothetical protein
MRKLVRLASHIVIFLICLASWLWAQQRGHDELIEKLKSGDSAVREKGIEEIAEERKKTITAVTALLNTEGVAAVNRADLTFAEKRDPNIYDNVADLEYNRSVGVVAIQVLGEMRAEEAAELLAHYIYFRARTPSKSKVRLARDMPTDKDWPAVVALTRIGKTCAEPLMSVYIENLSVKHFHNVERILLNVLGTWKTPPEEYSDRTIDQHELHTMNERLNAHAFVSSYLSEGMDDGKKAKLQIILYWLDKAISDQKEYYKKHYGPEFPEPAAQPPREQPQREEPKAQSTTPRQEPEVETIEWLVIPLAVVSVALAGAVVFLLLRRKGRGAA